MADVNLHVTGVSVRSVGSGDSGESRKWKRSGYLASITYSLFVPVGVMGPLAACVSIYATAIDVVVCGHFTSSDVGVNLNSRQ